MYIYIFLKLFLLEEAPSGNQTGRKISQQAPGTPKSDMSAKPAYINVNYNPGYLSDDGEMGVEEGVL